MDGMSAVVRPDQGNPRILEIIGRFFDRERAVAYAAYENSAFQDLAQKIAAKSTEFKAAGLLDSIPAPVSVDLPAGQKTVFDALRSAADEDGLAALSGKDIAERANIPTGSLKTHTDALISKGYIELVQSGGGSGNPNVYRILGKY
jgi:hypothetical protein